MEETLLDIFHIWEEQHGFNGELWVGYDEWLNNEFSNSTEINTIFIDPEYLKNKYRIYQLQWMIDHGYSLNNLIESIADLMLNN